jgi:toxin-antitoxin system PIN domain toxin
VAAAFLLDANVLVALAWPEHEFHERVGRWFARHSRSGWATCPITQGAFVGILSNPAFSPNALSPANALRVLETNLSLPDHEFWPDSISVPDSIELTRTRLRGHQQITDAYLLGLALHHRGKLATMDEGTVAWGPDGAVELVA